ncbi:MAG: DNA-3-methyladenine glycosylase I [Planctomycetota bacterium]|jgi:DNA-3-methyladenine glycosylase I
MSERGLIKGEDGVRRCWWCGEDPLYRSYHDHEWGMPVIDDRELFEKIALDGFQAGLSWITILRRREAFRRAFADFRIERVARYNSRSVARLLADPSIIRHRGKIEATINNARRALELIKEQGSLADYIWGFAPPGSRRPRRVTRATLPAYSAESAAMSRDLRQRGWSFVGPTIVYAFMQAVGLVNDHLHGCDVHPRVERARRARVKR